MVTGSDLEERGAVRGGDPLGLDHQLAPDATGADPRVHDQRDDAGELLVRLEAGQDVEGDETDGLPSGLRDEDARVVGGEPGDAAVRSEVPAG